MSVIAINTPARRGWRWRIYDDVGGMVVESRGTFRTNADALAAGQGRARQMKARSAVKFVVAEPEIDVPGLTGRSPYRIPKLLQGRVTLSRLAAVANDPRVNPKSGWLIDKRSIESYVRGLPEELQLGTRQLYNTLYREDWLIRVGGRGGMTITHQASVHAYLGSHHAGAQDAHRTAGLLGAPTDVAAGARWGSGETLAR